MKIPYRFVMILSVIVLMCSLCACAGGMIAHDHPYSSDPQKAEQIGSLTQQNGIPTEPQTQALPAFAPEEDRPMLAGDGYYRHRVRMPVALQDMKCPEITREDFDMLLDAVRDAAKNNRRADFHTACYEVQQAIRWIETAYVIASNENAADPMDEETAERMQTLEQDNIDFSNLFYGVMHEISCGQNAQILRWEFDSNTVAFFESFDPTQADQLSELETQKTELVIRYEQLISEDEPAYDEIAELYVRLVEICREEAEMRGYSSYASYAYEAEFLRDYTPEDARKIWKTAKEDFAPLLNKYIYQVMRAAGKAEKRFAYDGSDQAVLQALACGAGGMSPEIRDACEYLLQYGLYDIAYSEEKLNQGYTVWMSTYEVPFIFNCPCGEHYDFCDMFHEFGHYTASFYGDCESDFDLSDFDLSELQSQGMEIMFFEFYDEIFGEENAAAFRAETLCDLIDSVVEGALYDEFQQKVFEEENLTADRVSELYLQTCKDYGINYYPGLEDAWMNVMHNFESPFYYISYAISAIPALELFVRQQEDPAEAMDIYLRISAMSGIDYYLTDALKKTGLANMMASPCGDVLAEKIEQTGALDVH